MQAALLLALIEIDGQVVENAAQLRKRTDFPHNNIAELDAMIKGINLALKWGPKNIEVRGQIQ